LGRTEVELALSRDAAEHLDFCLRTFSVSSRDEVRDANKRFRELFNRVRREVTALTLEVRPLGAEITVDGASFGMAPLGRDLFLAPGPHLVRAHLNGYEDEERAVTADAGGTLAVTIALAAVPVAPATAAAAAPVAPAPAAAPAPSPVATPRVESGMEPRTIVLLSGAGASLVALGLGAYFALSADSAQDDASRLGATAHAGPDPACTTGVATSTCASLRNAVEREQDNRSRADIALTTGALLGGVTVGAWLLSPDIARSGTARVKAAPWVASGGSGLAVFGVY